MSMIHRDGVGVTSDQQLRGAPGGLLSGGGDRVAVISPALLKRLEVLPARDRAIVELSLRSNLSRTSVARVTGLSPGQVSRRLRTLYARLHDPLVVALFDPRCPLAPEYRQVGIEHFLLRKSANQLAEKHRLPAEQVRRMLGQVRWWHRGVNTGWTGCRPNDTSRLSRAARPEDVHATA